MSQSSLLPTVTLIGGTLRVSSLEIAEKFGKRHERVLDAIRRIAAELPEDFREHNFVSTFVDVSCPKGAVRKSPAYSLTRDAFSLVVMGFTGKTALAWKVRYIEAFNALEAELTKKATHRGRKALPNALPENRTSSREAELIAEIAYLKGTLGLIEKVARTCETKSQVMWSMIITYSQDTKPGESEWMKILQA